MAEQRIGACSICGGEVRGHVGPWMGVVPPPPPRCQKCGAVSAAHDPVIRMRPVGGESETRNANVMRRGHLWELVQRGKGNHG